MPGPGTWSPGDILTADDLNAIGVWESYTPVLDQNGTRSATINYAEYVVINKMCIVNVDLTCTTTGSANNIIQVSLPVASVSGIAGSGSGTFFDSSATDVYLLAAVVSSSVGVVFQAETSTGNNFGATPNVTLGNNDVLSFSIVYQVA
jgi:hypothetical protein